MLPYSSLLTPLEALSMHLRYSLLTGHAATFTPNHCTLQVTLQVTARACTTGAQAPTCTTLHLTALPELHCKVEGCKLLAS